MKLTSFFVATLVPLTFALPTIQSMKPRASINQITDTLLFTDTISQFEAARDKKNPSSLDWASDGCSDSPDNPLGFDFEHCCHRHDFGYRNYKAQNRFSDDNKDKIDSNFKDDMYDVCDSKSLFEKEACKGVADIYYEAVHTFGSKKRAAEIVKAQLEER